MVETMTLDSFRDGMLKARPNCFSYEAFEPLFDWYEQLEEIMPNEPIEFDPVAIDSEWYEYDNAKEAAEDIGTDVDEDDFDIEDYDGDEDERQEDLEKAYREDLEQKTTVLVVEDGRILVNSN